MDIMVHPKGRNKKVFSNFDIDPREALNLAKLKSKLWTETHVINDTRLVQAGQIRPNYGITGR